MKLLISNDETVQEVMDQLRFVLMEMGIVMSHDQISKEMTEYQFVHAKPLDSEEK